MKIFTAKGEQSRKRILNEAIRVFAKKGFAGASVDEIVDAVKVNKRMVYHYFGNKETLFQTALATVYGKLEALEIQTLHPEEPIEKIIGGIVSAYFSFLQDNPEFVHLLLWENLNRGGHLDSMAVPLNKDPMLNLLVEAITISKKNGTVRKDVDPKFLLISLIGNCMVYCSNRYTLSHALRIDLHDPKILNRAKKTVIQLLINGIIPDGKN
ncbi:MAG: TetR/AcrR family transcriptional regulator [Kiritimatiellales bacterium]